MRAMLASSPPVSPWLRALLVGAAAFLLFARLGELDASAPDEPRYLQISEEVRALDQGPSGLVLLHLNEEPYTQKPPLYYWLAAAVGAMQGRVTELAGRIPSAASGVLLVWLTLSLGSRLLGGRAGIVGAALLLTTYEFARLARRVQLDPLLALLEALALAAFWRLDRGMGGRATNAAVFHAALGLAVLTKGPVGFLIPVLIVVAYLAWEGRLRDIGRAFPWWGPLLSVAPGIAWIAAATAFAPAGFADAALRENLLGRLGEGAPHDNPIYYYVYQLPLDFLPWTLLFPVAGIGAFKTLRDSATSPELKRAWRFLLAIVGASFVFFSLSSGKRGLYLLPAFPAVALLCAGGLERWLAGRARAPKRLAFFAIAIGLLFALLGALALQLGSGAPLPGLFKNDWLGRWVGPRDLASVDLGLLRAFGLTLFGAIVAAVVAWIALQRARSSALRFVFVPIGLAYGALFATFALLFPAIDPLRSVRPLAEAAAARTPAGQAIGLYDEHNLVGGLAYYASREHPILELATPADVQAFFRSGGRVVVARERKLEGVALGEVVERFRSGERQVVLIAPSGGR
jgi:4-amino-4-deoxy-L-arabinose transferase-like glycosyltransferase